MEPNKYHVEVSQKAAQMLVSHAAFLAQVSVNAAKRLRACLESLRARLACIFSAIFCQNPSETNVSLVIAIQIISKTQSTT